VVHGVSSGENNMLLIAQSETTPLHCMAHDIVVCTDRVACRMRYSNEIVVHGFSVPTVPLETNRVVLSAVTTDYVYYYCIDDSLALQCRDQWGEEHPVDYKGLPKSVASSSICVAAIYGTDLTTVVIFKGYTPIHSIQPSMDGVSVSVSWWTCMAAFVVHCLDTCIIMQMQDDVLVRSTSVDVPKTVRICDGFGLTAVSNQLVLEWHLEPPTHNILE
jgi:hypothetical protein